MRAGVRKWTESAIKRRTNVLGLGVGEGVDYKTALRVQDTSSSAPQTRMFVAELDRVLHLQSLLERQFVLIKSFEVNLEELQEGKPMDRTITLGAAELFGIRHSVYPRSIGAPPVPLVMTMDFVLTEKQSDGSKVKAAWDVKPEKDLLDPRVQEKLSLHKAYCAHIGMPHYLFTEKSAPPRYAFNIDWLRCSRQKQGEVLPVSDLFTRHPRVMVAELASKQTQMNIRQYCIDYGQRHGLKSRDALRVFKRLTWMHCVRLDLTVRDVTSLPLPAPSSIKFIDRHGTNLA